MLQLGGLQIWTLVFGVPTQCNQEGRVLCVTMVHFLNYQILDTYGDTMWYDTMWYGTETDTVETDTVAFDIIVCKYLGVLYNAMNAG